MLDAILDVIQLAVNVIITIVLIKILIALKGGKNGKQDN